MVTVDQLLTQAQEELAAAPFNPPRREARLLLSNVLDWNEARVLSRGETVVPLEAEARFRALLRRRVTGEPVAYLLGQKEFFGRSFLVDSRVLIPRPETEHLVEAALERQLATESRILDLGTGSGCLAVTLACEIPSAHVVAVDTSIGALAVAQRNIDCHGVRDRVTLVSADLASAIDPRAFDMVVSNPPYVDPGEASALSPEVVDFEPTQAVFAPTHGDSIIRRLFAGLSELRQGTQILIEIGADQEPGVSRFLSSSLFELLEVRPDLAGRPRIVITRRK